MSELATKILAIDPGTTHSQLLLWDGEKVDLNFYAANWEILERAGFEADAMTHPIRVHIEAVASYGMPVGAEIFTTCFWVGRFMQHLHMKDAHVRLVFRRDVKLHLCGTARAKDANIRQALIDRFGGKAKAIGLKKTPGPLYGVTSHAWAALALAVTAHDNPSVGFTLEDAA